MTDVDWSPVSPGLLASSGLDSFVHAWDAERSPDWQPAVSFRTIVPASIVS